MLETGTELAITRTRLAADRTLMAWIRTSFSMITFGFGVAKFFQYLHEQQATAQPSLLDAPRNLGLILVSIGTLSLLAGAYEYWHALRRLREMSGSPQRAPTAIGVIAILVGIFGLLALVGIAFRSGPLQTPG
jgi:putative membrane protein